jgi:hypothetical protein
MPPKLKADTSSAIRKVAAVLGADPGLIPVDPANLRRRLEGISHQVAGVSPGRWNNIRSLFRKAIAMVTPMLPGRSVFPLLPSWGGLSTDKDFNFNRRTRLLPMLRYFSERALGPAEVTLALLEEYHQAILQDRLRSKPEKAWDGLVWAWNACVREVPGWPQVPIPRSEKREIYIFPWSFFPESLHEDAQGYLPPCEGRWHGPIQDLQSSLRGVEEIRQNNRAHTPWRIMGIDHRPCRYLCRAVLWSQENQHHRARGIRRLLGLAKEDVQSKESVERNIET